MRSLSTTEKVRITSTFELGVSKNLLQRIKDPEERQVFLLRNCFHNNTRTIIDHSMEEMK